MSSQMRVSNDHYEWSLQARSFPLPTAAPERDTERAAWVNPELRASNDHFLKWEFREHGITQAALSLPIVRPGPILLPEPQDDRCHTHTQG